MKQKIASGIFIFLSHALMEAIEQKKRTMTGFHQFDQSIRMYSPK
jgi:ADP-glucose pyrophosphorylase